MRQTVIIRLLVSVVVVFLFADCMYRGDCNNNAHCDQWGNGQGLCVREDDDYSYCVHICERNGCPGSSYCDSERGCLPKLGFGESSWADRCQSGLAVDGYCSELCDEGYLGEECGDGSGVCTYSVSRDIDYCALRCTTVADCPYTWELCGDAPTMGSFNVCYFYAGFAGSCIPGPGEHSVACEPGWACVTRAGTGDSICTNGCDVPGELCAGGLGRCGEPSDGVSLCYPECTSAADCQAFSPLISECRSLSSLENIQLCLPPQ